MRFPSIKLHDSLEEADGTSSKDSGEFRYSRAESFGHLIRIVNRAFVRSLQLRLERNDVTVGQWAFLRILWERNGELTQRELAEMVGLMESSAKFALNGLERAGLVERVQSSEDRRKHHFWLTAEGSALKNKLLPYAKEVSDAALKGLDPEEIVALERSIQKVVENLQEDIELQGQVSTAKTPAHRKRRKKGT